MFYLKWPLTLIKSFFTSSPLSPVSAAKGQFVRFEDKYLISQELAEKLIPIIETHLDNASPIPNTQFTLVESLYFDTKKLTALQDYLNKEPNRSKMRIRRYAPNGNWSTDIFLELKSKSQGVSSKSRLLITPNDQIKISNGQILAKTPELQKMNSLLKVRKLEKRINDVNYFVENLKASPMCKVSYSRLAYEKNNFRVTLDNQLQFKNLFSVSNSALQDLTVHAENDNTLRDIQKFNPENTFVLEVKHNGQVPFWISEFLNKHQIVKNSFSKYCYCMSFAVRGYPQNS